MDSHYATSFQVFDWESKDSTSWWNYVSIKSYDKGTKLRI